MTVSIQNVSKRFGQVTALDNVSLEIAEGEFFALLGPSGCGKTTLLRAIGGFEFPDAGRIELDGTDMSRVPPNMRPVNTVFQSYAVFPHLDVFDNVAYGLRVTGSGEREVRDRVEGAIAMTKLEGFEKRMPNQLSGGQRQRVALARALVKRPKVLLLDEPLSALDKKLRESMQNELVRLRREVGITFVIVTHDQAEALAVADKIAVMKAGRIVQVDTPRQLYETPNSRFVAGFLGSANCFDCKLQESKADSAVVFSALFGTIEVKAANANPKGGTLVIRPERISILAETASVPINLVAAPATLEQTTYQGNQTIALARLTDGQPIEALLQNHSPAPELNPGATCQIALNPNDLLLVEDAENPR